MPKIEHKKTTYKFTSNLPPCNWKGLSYLCIRDTVILFTYAIVNNIAWRVDRKDRERCFEIQQQLVDMISYVEETCLYIKTYNRPIEIKPIELELSWYNNLTKATKSYNFKLEFWSLCQIPLFQLWKFLKSMMLTGIKTFYMIAKCSHALGVQTENEVSTRQLFQDMLDMLPKPVQEGFQYVHGHIEYVQNVKIVVDSD